MVRVYLAGDLVETNLHGAHTLWTPAPGCPTVPGPEDSVLGLSTHYALVPAVPT